MEDLVDSPLSVIISCIDSHKSAAGLAEEREHPDTDPRGETLPVARVIKVFETSVAAHVSFCSLLIA